MTMSAPKKIVFILIAILLPLLLIELTSSGLLRIFFPQAYSSCKRSTSKDQAIFRTDYSANDFSKENYDYTKDFYGPYLQNTSLTLPERLIGPRAFAHYLRVDRYTLFPFTMFHVQRNYRSAIVNTNHLGFRALEFSEYEQDPRPKIIVLGGSAIFGTNLTSDDQTVSSQLQSYLRRQGLEVTCINLAMGGYTSEQEMITLNRIGMRFSPSLVIAIDGCNDVVHYSKHRDLPHLFPRLARLYYGGIPPDSAPGTYVKALTHKLGQYSSFFCLADALASKPQDQYAAEIDGCALFPDKSAEKALIENYLNAHLMMFSLCRGRKIGYIAGLQPMCGMWLNPRWQGEEDQSIQPNKNFVNLYSLLDKNLQALAQKEGFPYINFGEMLAKEKNTCNFSDVVHLTDMSAKIMAEHLGKMIVANYSGLFAASQKP